MKSLFKLLTILCILLLSSSTYSASPLGGGPIGGGISGAAALITVDTTNFDNNLSPLDDTVQEALETLDDILGGGATARFVTGETTNSFDALDATQDVTNGGTGIGEDDHVYVTVDTTTITNFVDSNPDDGAPHSEFNENDWIVVYVEHAATIDMSDNPNIVGNCNKDFTGLTTRPIALIFSFRNGKWELMNNLGCYSDPQTFIIESFNNIPYSASTPTLTFFDTDTSDDAASIVGSSIDANDGQMIMSVNVDNVSTTIATLDGANVQFVFDKPSKLYTAADPDISIEGQVSWDNNNDWIRGYDGAQKVAGFANPSLVYTVPDPENIPVSFGRIKPNILLDNMANGTDYIVTAVKCISDTDDYSFTLYESGAWNNNTEAGDDPINTSVCSTNGPNNETFTDNDVVNHTINSGNNIIFEHESGTANSVTIIITGYWDANK